MLLTLILHNLRDMLTDTNTGFERAHAAPSGLMRAACVAVIATVGVAAAASAEPTLRLAAIATEEAGRVAVPPLQRALIRRVQETLAELGYYTGPLDGVVNRRTGEAIRLYQRRSKLEVDGRATKELLNHLSFADQVRQLQSRLAGVRETQISQARIALSRHETTRRLLNGTKDTVADAARDAQACFDAPNVRCLLNESLESAKAVFRPRFRDWVLGEILIAQARAGFPVEALATLARIEDPRLIVAGLRNMSRAQAESGYVDEARATAATIPLSWSRAEALAAVAVAQAREGDAAGARDTVSDVLAMSDEPTDVHRRVGTLRVLAVALARAGLPEVGRAALERAVALAHQADAAQQDALLSEVATALAEMNRVDQALDMLDEVVESNYHRPVLAAAAQAQARAGFAREAVDTASAMSEVRYRAVVLSEIAIVQHRGGHIQLALDTLAGAVTVSDAIESANTYPRDYALSRIAIAFIAVEALPRAVEIASQITDSRLGADAFWSIAAAQRRSGDTAGLGRTDALAANAMADIKSPLDRAWVWSNLASTHARAGDREAAERAFTQALAVARDITSPWARTQALAKVAATLIDLQ